MPLVYSDDESSSTPKRIDPITKLTSSLLNYPLTSPCVVTVSAPVTAVTVTSSISSPIVSSMSCEPISPCSFPSSKPTVAYAIGILKQLSAKFDIMSDRLMGIESNFNAVVTELSELRRENLDLKSEVTELKAANNNLVQSIGHLELHTREKFLLFSGPSIKYEKETPMPSLIGLVRDGLRHQYNIDISPDKVSSCRKFGKRNAEYPKILVEFTTLDEKNRIKTATIPPPRGDPHDSTARKPPPSVYVNEFLSEYHSNLLFKLRNLRRSHPDKIYSTYSRDGKIYFKSSFRSTPVYVRCDADINRLFPALI